MSNWAARSVAAVTGLGAACFAWGLAEASMFTVRRVELPALPPGGANLRVLHVSDTHLRPSQHRKLDFLRSLGRLRPDLIVNTGDNIADAGAIDPLMGALSTLSGTPGVFVFGSNDYHAPRLVSPLRYLTHGRSEATAQAPDLPTETLRRAMEDVGWVDLNHHRQVLEVGGYRIGFRGTDDAHHDRDNYSLVAGPDEGVDLSVGVTHAPYRRVLEAMTSDAVELIFAGHTHGGQVCVPLHGALTSNCDLPTRQAKGVSRHQQDQHSALLHVSAGVGTSPYAPYRFACRPEVTLLTLVARETAVSP